MRANLRPERCSCSRALRARRQIYPGYLRVLRRYRRPTLWSVIVRLLPDWPKSSALSSRHPSTLWTRHWMRMAVQCFRFAVGLQRRLRRRHTAGTLMRRSACPEGGQLSHRRSCHLGCRPKRRTRRRARSSRTACSLDWTRISSCRGSGDRRRAARQAIIRAVPAAGTTATTRSRGRFSVGASQAKDCRTEGNTAIPLELWISIQLSSFFWAVGTRRHLRSTRHRSRRRGGRRRAEVPDPRPSQPHLSCSLVTWTRTSTRSLPTTPCRVTWRRNHSGAASANASNSEPRHRRTEKSQTKDLSSSYNR